MFSLHETTKTHLCRIAFVALCLVPACAVVAWCVVVRLPSYREAHERAIAARLGVHAQLVKVSSPLPNMLLYEGLVLYEPESRQRLASLPFVEVHTSGNATLVKLPFPAEVNGDRLDAFWKVAHEKLCNLGDALPLSIEAQNVTLHLADGDQSLTDVRVTMQSSAESSQLHLTFQRATAGEERSGAAELTIARKRDVKPPTTEIQFTTPATALPCDLVASLCPTVQHFGKESAFQGQITAVERAGQWTAKLTGTLSGVDLDRLVSDQFHHKLTGTAQTDFSMTIEQGRIATARGRLDAGPGHISRSLIHAAQKHLEVNLASDILNGRSHVLPYRQLSINFSIDAHGLTLGGGRAGSNAILIDDKKHTLVFAQSPNSKLVVNNLVRTLVPDSQFQVPSTKETDLLTRILPVQSIEPLPGTEQPLEAKKIQVWKARK